MAQPVSASDKVVLERIYSTFARFAADEPTTKQLDELVATAKRFSEIVVELCQEGMERSNSLAKLEEAMLWAHAAVRRS